MIINEKMRVEKDPVHHGAWRVVDVQTGRVVSRCVRTIDDLADLVKDQERRENR